jgi:hypothetical protein
MGEIYRDELNQRHCLRGPANGPLNGKNSARPCSAVTSGQASGDPRKPSTTPACALGWFIKLSATWSNPVSAEGRSKLWKQARKAAISSSRPHSLGRHDCDRSRLPPLVPFSKPSVIGARACRIATSGDRLSPTTPSPISAPFRRPAPVTECGRRSSKPWYSSNRRLWSSGIAEPFGFTGDGDHVVPDGPRRATKYVT